jgi:hypothetical protein
MQAFGDEAGEAFLRLRDGIRTRDPDGIEAQRPRFTYERCVQIVRF